MVISSSSQRGDMFRSCGFCPHETITTEISTLYAPAGTTLPLVTIRVVVMTHTHCHLPKPIHSSCISGMFLLRLRIDKYLFSIGILQELDNRDSRRSKGPSQATHLSYIIQHGQTPTTMMHCIIDSSSSLTDYMTKKYPARCRRTRRPLRGKHIGRQFAQSTACTIKHNGNAKIIIPSIRSVGRL